MKGSKHEKAKFLSLLMTVALIVAVLSACAPLGTGGSTGTQTPTPAEYSTTWYT